MAVLRSLMRAMAAMPMAHAALAEPPHHPMHVDQPPLQVELGETVEKVAVTVEYLGGHTRSGDMTVTHYQPTGAGPFPAIVIQHGRASNRRTLPWRWRMIMQARFWTRRGFAVFVPTRLGYGETGLHPDPEIAGRCDAPELKPMIRVLTDQNTAAIEFARRKPWVDPDRVLLLGQSLGGLASLATGAVRLPGVAGIINFAGGFGGRPDRLRNPCAPERLAAILGEIGTAATVPSLWIYAENDQLWGADWPRDWHRAYVGNGADPQRTSSAEFHMLPAIGVEGHDFQVKGFGLWPGPFKESGR